MKSHHSPIFWTAFLCKIQSGAKRDFSICLHFLNGYDSQHSLLLPIKIHWITNNFSILLPCKNWNEKKIHFWMPCLSVIEMKKSFPQKANRTWIAFIIDIRNSSDTFPHTQLHSACTIDYGKIVKVNQHITFESNGNSERLLIAFVYLFIFLFICFISCLFFHLSITVYSASA